ncbi:MAG: hypothetical protein R3E35_01865 [Rhodocyclaceae bacterium]
MATYLLTIGLIFVLLAAVILVQGVYRRFAQRHPELGPFREEKGCGSCSAGSGCSSTACAPSRRD